MSGRCAGEAECAASRVTGALISAPFETGPSTGIATASTAVATSTRAQTIGRYLPY